MRTLLISLCMLLIGISAYAEDYFPDSTINNLQVYKTDKARSTAWIRDQANTKEVVSIEDKIGVEEAIVVKIDNASITVRSGRNRTKMPVIPESVFSQDASSDKPFLPFEPE